VPTLFWDASGLAKRYTEEVGNDTAESLFHQVPAPRMVTTLWGYTETFSLLLRKHNDGRLKASFATTTSALRNDLVGNAQFFLLAVTDSAILSSIMLIRRHNINATDAALLAALLHHAQTTGETCVLVAADVRFCRAAQAEGLPVINPQVMPAADVAAFLAAL